MPAIFKKLIKDERGLSFILASVGMMALVGMAALVTDFGRIAITRQQLVNAADSAAMAGALVLSLDPDPSTREMAASQKALEVAVANGAPAGGVTVSIDGRRVTVDADKTVGLIMSKAFGIVSRDVHSHALAVVGGVNTYQGVAPLCIREQPLEYGQLCTIKYGSPDTSGNFGALALGGTGASTYRDNLINGFEQPVSIGDSLLTEPGNMAGPTDGIDQRLALCTDGCTYKDFKPGCPRALIIPMYNEDLHGRTTFKVTKFAVFFIDREATISGTDEIKGYFVSMAGDGEVDPSQPPTGLYGVKLIE